MSLAAPAVYTLKLELVDGIFRAWTRKKNARLKLNEFMGELKLGLAIRGFEN